MAFAGNCGKVGQLKINLAAHVHLNIICEECMIRKSD